MATPGGDSPTLQPVAERWSSARHGQLTVASAALGRAAEVRVLLPPETTGRRHPPPLLLLLHGADAVPGDWERGVAIERRCRDLDAVVLMPDGGPIGFCTDWLGPERRPAGPRALKRAPAETGPAWERFHVEELLGWAAQRFGSSRRRVVLGISMGGHGAIAYAARHPGTFAAAASFSGVLDTLGRGIPSLIAAALLQHRQHRHALWGSPLTERARWIAHNPRDLAPALAGVSLYLARGDGCRHPADPDFGAMAGPLERLIGSCTDAMARRLAELGIDATISHGRGVHEWPTWNRELDRAWPFLLAGLGLT